MPDQQCQNYGITSILFLKFFSLDVGSVYQQLYLTIQIVYWSQTPDIVSNKIMFLCYSQRIFVPKF